MSEQIQFPDREERLKRKAIDGFVSLDVALEAEFPLPKIGRLFQLAAPSEAEQ